MEDLQIALVQTDLHWQDKSANLAMLEEKLWSNQTKADLIILPEMFPTGFTMEVETMGEPMNFNTTKWMQQMASQFKAVVTGSVIIKENGAYYNRLLWVTPEGTVSHYDKRHLFRMAQEDAYFDMGMKNQIVKLKGWNILMQVCYDLRFPVWSRNHADESGNMAYDMVYYVASWPAPRASAWDILLKARAVENLAYAIGVNRIGTDGNEVPYIGHSAAYDFKGETLAFADEKEEILSVTLSKKDLKRYREKFPAWKDSDRFELRT
ncbi:amidohydrolase [Pararhodonellum marinum]|uniref:amidohydrolase n=1 Tax=Pararhodonellum marinum TaxID=2755358 RepID=UPI00188FCE70|nr:amidohydrolase [Pararhodonellum marinum]